MANDVAVQGEIMPPMVKPLKDVRFFNMGNSGYEDLPKEDMSQVSWDKYELFNKEANEAQGLDEALTAFRKSSPENRKKDLPMSIIGYRFSEREFQFEDKITHIITPTLANIIYLYTADEKVYFVHGTTFTRNFLNILRMFGVPSAQPNGEFNIELSSVNENGKNRYIVELQKPTK